MVWCADGYIYWLTGDLLGAAHLMLVVLAVSSSGDTYSAVPTNELLRSVERGGGAVLSPRPGVKQLHNVQHKSEPSPQNPYCDKFGLMCRVHIACTPLPIPNVLPAGSRGSLRPSAKSASRRRAVPKSVILMCISPDSSIFSGLRSTARGGVWVKGMGDDLRWLGIASMLILMQPQDIPYIYQCDGHLCKGQDPALSISFVEE